MFPKNPCHGDKSLLRVLPLVTRFTMTSFLFNLLPFKNEKCAVLTSSMNELSTVYPKVINL
jgi:hypothetical protein